MIFKSITGVMYACLLVTSFNASAALVERLNGKAYYDTQSGLTWLTDANYAQTSGYDADGRMGWGVANTWAAGLNIDGVTGWRLPDTIDVGNDGVTYIDNNQYQGVDAGYNITTQSELSNMFYNLLGNTARFDVTGTDTGCYTDPNFCLTNTGPFINIQINPYWSATEYAPDTKDQIWAFNMRDGMQTPVTIASTDYAWAVKSGDISAVPVPAAAWLLGSGLLGLI